MLLYQYSADVLKNTTDDDISTLIAWVPSVRNNYWSSIFDSVTVNNVSVPVTVKAAIFDSGASLIYMPTNDFTPLMAQITKGKTCITDTSAKTFCPCTSINDTSFPSIVIKTG
jgi:hypothetical protein